MARILVIDDDDTIRLSLRLTLEDADYDVAEAANGEEGLALMRAGSFDLVITDIFMPEKEGIETIDEIRRNYADTKIISISGGSRMDPDAYLDIAERVGADQSLSKPFDIQLLLDMVAKLLQTQ
ncbi:response regulator [Desulfosarcina ovata subsp. sediminis]|uniref:Response regulator n=1 Tax=Desulfosarcina ovata subsp. sediminis TaxID=885957 RepID=A0A5K7ZN83_9BACT|nr:response regulator [Desulfosarcina ovata]BBO82621.1 response regulator [Desulfosarcina ovata subsp. sediminis]